MLGDCRFDNELTGLWSAYSIRLSAQWPLSKRNDCVRRPLLLPMIAQEVLVH
jgi:hypothetical protein